MRHFMLSYILFSCCSLSIIVNAEEEDNDDDVPKRLNLTCHYNHNDTNLSKDTMISEIDSLLDELYSLIKKDARFEDECNVSVEFNFTRFNQMQGDLLENSTRPPAAAATVVEYQLDELLEGFEVKRNKYEQGLWGYCAQDGGEELKRNISAVIETARNTPIVMCDKDHLLSCHTKFHKCQCLVDNKNFRDVASDYWDEEEESSETGISIGKSLCALIVGSDCPIGDTIMMCYPGSKCLYKANLTECNSLHRKVKILEERRLTVDLDQDVKLYFRSAGNSSTDNTTVAPYRVIRKDYPSVHCQCYGYIGGSGAGIIAPIVEILSCTELLSLFTLFYFSSLIVNL